MQAPPSAVPVKIYVTTHGARIIDEEPDTVGQHGIYLPNHVEYVSHIAIDVGGSLAKVVYFTHPSDDPAVNNMSASGTLSPISLRDSLETLARFTPDQSERSRSIPTQLSGGRLNFCKFETSNIDACLSFLRNLIEMSAIANKVSVKEMQRSVKLMATGGGAHLFYSRFEQELGVEVHREDEMQCLITGLNFMTLVPDEVYWYSDELVDALFMPHPTSESAATQRDDSGQLSAGANPTDLPRPSPRPPLYSPRFETQPSPKLPCLLVNIGSGVSILKIDEGGEFERVSGTSLGGGTLWGLLALLTDAKDFDEMLSLSEDGENSNVDMLVSDIYGPVGLNNLGLKASTIASSFGKVLRKDESEDVDDNLSPRERRQRRFDQRDICRSLLYAISNNIGQIAHLNAEKYNIDRIYFGGCFIRGHQATISTLSYAIRFWSQGRRRAYFLRHEGYLGAVGAWVRHLGLDPTHMDAAEGETRQDPSAPNSPAVIATHLQTPKKHSKELRDVPPQPQLNPLLAEALNGLSLERALGTDTLAHDTKSPEAAAAAAAAAQDAPAELTELLKELESVDEQELADDPERMADLLKRLDQADQVATMLEGRVDTLLARLNDCVEPEK
ncbi:pantothenate kinase [Malassezia cuniculi]|uniref:Pantothenate kinase n=1 Tax=Malassezia cuniculi TaxID=948313 RepID=A0AAF0J6I9_9BASI|nr:pantothenate kinase [Malassezia cuniculi]